MTPLPACDCTVCYWSSELPDGWWCHDRIKKVPADHCCQEYRERKPFTQDPPGWERIRQNFGTEGWEGKR